MRKIVVLSLFAAMFFVSSCGNKQKTRTEEVAAFRSELTAEDTTQMLRMCDDAMEQLKARNIDQVLASLQEYSDSTNEIKPLTGHQGYQYALSLSCRLSISNFTETCSPFLSRTVAASLLPMKDGLWQVFTSRASFFAAV